MDTANFENENFATNLKTIIGFRIQIGKLLQIEEIRKRYRLRDRSTAIIQLIDLGLHFEKKIGTAETWTSEDMQAIKQQLENGQLVDWVAELKHKQFETLLNIFKEEEKFRMKAREGQQRLTI